METLPHIKIILLVTPIESKYQNLDRKTIISNFIFNTLSVIKLVQQKV